MKTIPVYAVLIFCQARRRAAGDARVNMLEPLYPNTVVPDWVSAEDIARLEQTGHIVRHDVPVPSLLSRTIERIKK
ncbi:hypothetical protein [Tessaracoccus lacteus]|uniref:Uncharacterized protein n=1 Tax=Tessaracoccus lacteus TaxID=3041766 RepID=A0ABY8PXP3_9ACTN|nr:hypothetical protein [Tessaracoccus sp. T21]WGT47225.1 hypothetical protein QH948_00055 [Tessaracoccus sp. T21]